MNTLFKHFASPIPSSYVQQHPYRYKVIPLSFLRSGDLILLAHKTAITPKSTTVFGWIWLEGKLSASPHRVTKLSTYSWPTTVKTLQSFLGAYKFLARVIPNCSFFLSPLETLITGKTSQDDIEWTKEMNNIYCWGQQHLQNHKSITLPKPDDQLWLVTDGAVKTLT